MTNIDAWKDVRQKVLFTVLILVVYRFGTYIPLPCINTAAIVSFAKVAKSGIFGMFNMFSGGSMSRVSIFALGIMPYITASIVVQLVVATTPALKKMKREDGEAGQRVINKYTKYLTVVVGLFQGYMLAGGFISMGLYDGVHQIIFRLLAALTMIAGSLSLIWMGELCTNKGLGNGSSIIIFAGIVSEAPRDFLNTIALSKSGNISVLAILLLLLVFFATIALVVFVERSNRLIYIQYPRQANAGWMSKNTNLPNFLPLKVNVAGVVPPIFASALLLLPVTIATVTSNKVGIIGRIASHFTHGQPIFIISYVILVVFFTFFYSGVIFDPKDISDNLKRGGVFIPGCRPGQPTADMISSILSRLSLIGAIYLAVICVIPELLSPVFGYSFLVGGTGILIVVGVIMDVISNIQTMLLYGKYNSSMKKKFI